MPFSHLLLTPLAGRCCFPVLNSSKEQGAAGDSDGEGEAGQMVEEEDSDEPEELHGDFIDEESQSVQVRGPWGSRLHCAAIMIVT